MPHLAKYELLEEIGHGGMASVYRARDRRLDREVAVKVIHPHLRESREVAARFQAEAKAVAKLRHPNIVEIYDVGDADEPEQYLVAELVRGTTLGRLRHKRGAVPPEIAGALALEILDALEHAHGSGVVHRDVKPENVLIEHRAPLEAEVDAKAADSQTAGRVAVKLTDFGIAKLLDAPGVTSTGQVLGSPAHMAPEQIEGGDVDARSDVFALGVVLYECVVGHLPFEGNNPAQVLRRVLEGDYPPAQRERPVVGDRWSSLVDRALAHSPSDRFQTARDMRDAIVEELSRLGFASPRHELEAWFDDPDVYERAYAKTLVDRLRARGDDARKRGDVISAASDYNRALAQAPGDARLLKVVAGIRRAEARARMLRRAAMAMALMFVVGTAASFLMRQDHRPTRAAPTSVRAGAAMSVIRQSTDERTPPESPPVARRVAAAPVVAAPASPRQREPAPLRATDRVLTLDLKPPMGVSVSIDGKPGRPVSTGDGLTVDTDAHVLSFSCPVCTPVERSIAAGDKPESLRVDVPVKPATLIVEGGSASHYQIVQHPELRVYVGKNPIRLKSAYELVTVEQIETGVQKLLRLEAGQPVTASFE